MGRARYPIVAGLLLLSYGARAQMLSSSQFDNSKLPYSITNVAASLISSTLAAAQMPAFTGDITTSAGSVATALKNTGSAGTYRSVTTDAQGRVTAGTAPTTFSGYAISDTSANLAAALTDETGSGLAVFQTSPTIITPTIASMVNAGHNHQNAAGGGTLGITAMTMNTGKLLGRTTAASGVLEEISAGTGLTLSAGTLSGMGYVISLFDTGNNNMAAATTYFYGQMSSRTINTTYSVAQIDVPKAGTIKRVSYKVDISGTVGTAAQNVTHTINVNNSTDCASSAFDYNTASINNIVTGVNQAVAVGDTIVLKVVTPGTWTTPATNVRIVAQVYIE